MTTYNPPTDAELDPEAPWTSDKAKRIRDVGISIAEGAAGAQRVQTAALADLSVTTAKLGAASVTKEKMASASVGQSQIDVTTDTQSTGNTVGVTITLPGGAYGFFPRLYTSNAGGGIAYWGDTSGVAGQSGITSPVSNIRLRSTSADTAYVRQTYINACRPYDHGDGEIGLFVFAMVDSNGVPQTIYAAEAAPWHYNGPTDIRAHSYDASGRGWATRDITETVFMPEDLTDYISVARRAGWRTVMAEEASLQRFIENGGKRDRFVHPGRGEFSLMPTWRALCEEQDLVAERVFGEPIPMDVIVGQKEIEITQAIKAADMPLIPHPFIGNDMSGMTVVMLDPVCDMTWLLEERKRAGESITDLFHHGYMRISNEQLDRSGPPGVPVVSYRWLRT